MDIQKLKMINNNVLFFFEGGNLDDKIEFKSGVILYKDTSYEPTFSIKDKAIALSCGEKTNIPDGAEVWVNYTVTHESKKPIHKDEKGVYYGGKDHDVYLWESGGKTETINQWVIVEPEKIEAETVTNSGIIIQNTKEKGNEKRGVIRFLNEKVQKRLGLKIGDTVLLASNAHYAFKYHGENLYRVDSELSINGVVDV